MVLLGASGDSAGPRLLLIKARVENPYGEACAPALGVMWLGAVARQAGWQVRAIDAWLEDEPEYAIQDALKAYPADVIGLSALTSEAKAMHRYARIAREHAPDALILAGGPHPSAYADETLENEAIDAVVMGEGEDTLRDILERVSQGRSFHDAPGTAVRRAGALWRNTPRPFIEDLDSLPMPAWDLTDPDAYARRRGQSLAGLRRYMPLMTSRGCPYRCTYCHDIQGKRFRAHSPEYVLRMIDQLEREHGVVNFDIIDDIFNFDSARMMDICDRVLQRPTRIGFTFPNGVRADRMKPEEAAKLSRAGCEYVAIAIESATGRVQKQIRKHLRFDKVLPVIETFTRHRVLTCGFFMIGFPSETEEDMLATIEFAARSRLHAAFFFVVTPFQGTELHEQTAAHSGDGVRDLTQLFVRQKVNLSAVPDARFRELRRRAYTRFYFDASRAVRTWQAFPRRKDLVELGLVMILRDTLGLSPGRVFEPLARMRGRLRRSLRYLRGGAPAITPGKLLTIARVGQDAPAPQRALTVVRDSPASAAG
jgi:anaerobic magnesium-protoporphyrin IX monomethyl ester cyclase